VVALAEDPEAEQGEIPVHLRDHAWFSAYAPADDPTIAIAVLVEHGGHGGGTAGPVVRKVIEAYLTTVDTGLDDAELRDDLSIKRLLREDG
jgi:penicillin-binding protein 2